MKYIYFDAPSGLSGDMILGALLDLGIPASLFIAKMSELQLPVEISVQEAKRCSIRGLKVNVLVQSRKKVARTWKDIEALIKNSRFSSSVKHRSLQIFRRLFEVEASVHGLPLSEAHLHEAGADDAIVDIVGACFLSEVLDIKEFYSSPMNLGKGSVQTVHGTLPVPPPAVAELLKGVPVYSAHADEELVTPTGAAVVTTLVKKYCPFPEITYEKIGYGAGRRDFADFPNILRAFYGNAKDFNPAQQSFMIEANIDDSTPEVLASFFDKAFKLGAQDVFLTPIVMKKNRLATKLTILAGVDKIDSLVEAVFRETSSIGVRYFSVARRVLERRLAKVKVLGEEIAVKVASLGGLEVNAQPEFSDCMKLSEKSGIPVKKVIELACAEYGKKAKPAPRKKGKGTK